MKKFVLKPLLIASLAMTLQAENWQILPVTQAGYKADVAVALLATITDIEDASESENEFGLEFSLNCPLLASSTNTIRQQVNLTTYTNNGIDLDIINISLNPHYMVSLTPTTSVGFGPSFGLSMIDFENENDTLFTYGVGASVRSDITKEFFVGAEARYELATDSDLDDSFDFSSTKFLLKVGYQL